jgi:hypothetical protein
MGLGDEGEETLWRLASMLLLLLLLRTEPIAPEKKADVRSSAAAAFRLASQAAVADGHRQTSITSD